MHEKAVEAMLPALPAAVRQRLTGAGLTAEELAPLLGWPGDALLLSGSVAEATANAASDLDFMVLREDHRPFAATVEDRRITAVDTQQSTFVDRILVVRRGIEFDVWVVSRAQLSPLTDVMRAALDDAGAIRRLPGLQQLEVKFLIRLHNGIVLQGHDRVRRWRAELRMDGLRPVLVASAVVGCLSYLEDAWSLGGLDGTTGDPTACLIAARAAGEQLVQAALGSAGVLSWDLRHAPVHRERLRAREVELPVPLRDMEALLFPGRDDPARYATKLLAACDRLVADLRGDPEMAPALDYLARFVPGRFDIDTSFVAP